MFDISKLEDNKQKIQKDLLELSPVIASINVIDQASLDHATEYASKAKARRKRIEELRVEFKSPLLKIAKMIDDWAKNLDAPYALAENSLKDKMKKYHLEQDRIARVAQEKLREEQEKQRLAEIEKAKLEAPKVTTPEQDLIMGTAQSVVPVQQAIEVKHDSTSKTDSGSSFTRKTWKFELVDLSTVPREFLCLHKGKVRDAIKAGSREIAGILIYEDIDVSIRA